MNKIVCFISFLLIFSACSKNSTNPNAPVPPVESDTHLAVTMYAADGVILPGHSTDTFLVQLKNPRNIKAVPVVYHFAVGAVPNSGSRLTDSTWADTVDLSQNKVHGVMVTARNGQTSKYGIAFQYLFINHPIVGGRQEYDNCIVFSGDTMYVGSAQGIYRSVDDGKAYTLVNDLGGGASVNAIFIQGSNIYAATNLGLSISADNGKTFSSHVFPTGYPLYINFPCLGVCAQGDTVYVTGGGVYISRDGGNTFAANAAGIQSAFLTSSIYVQGSAVYAGTFSGFAVSPDGGRSFVTYKIGLGDGSINNIQCNSFTLSNNIIYVADVSGVSISSNGGQSFVNYTSANGLSDKGNNWVTAVSADGNLVGAATNYGISISIDGGKNYLNYNLDYGLGSNSVSGVTVRGNTIYVATSWDIFGPGGLTIIKPR